LKSQTFITFLASRQIQPTLWFKLDSPFQLLLSTFAHERIRGIEDAPSLRAL
jgi:hypothetical protein